MKADAKATNPKDAMGVQKVPMHLVPGSAKAYLAMAFLEGALKYGKYNWRIAGVRSSIYLDAMERHLEKYKNGEDCDKVTKVPHLASIMACCAIILDAELVGKLKDDRPPRAEVSGLIDSLAEHVQYLTDLYDDEDPHQYTIDDTGETTMSDVTTFVFYSDTNLSNALDELQLMSLDFVEQQGTSIVVGKSDMDAMNDSIGAIMGDHGGELAD